jgi:hypothetical protein
MMSLIEKIAAAVTALVLLAPIRVCAEASREIYSDEEIISAINCAFDSEREKLGSESLAEGFISSGMAGESEADWYIVAEAAVGVEDDYAAYAAAAGTVLEERLGHSEDCYLTEIARTSAAIESAADNRPNLRKFL